jgi:hypothetical protein
MKTPLSISMSELSKVAEAAADRADQAAKEAGITPAGLLKRERAVFASARQFPFRKQKR